MSGNTTWPNTNEDVAVFQDALGGTVTVFTPIQTIGIVQNGADYTINANSITLAANSTSQPFIHVGNGELTIDSVLAGSDGLIKAGTGNLILSNTSTFTGGTRIDGGTLTLTGALAATSVEIATGTSLLDVSGGLADDVELINAGSLVINTSETVATYVQQVGGNLAGPASLTATTGATLHGGTISGSLAGDVTSTGTVLISGTLDGDSLSITGGTLTVDGAAAASVIAISTAASLAVTNGGLSSLASLVNAGTLTLGAAEGISAYVSSGGTLAAGGGMLSSNTSHLLDGSSVAGSLETGSLTSEGIVTVSGDVAADSIFITGGTLTNTGTFGTSSTLLDIGSGATFAAMGSQHYASLTTSGSGVGTWQGDLGNTSSIAPGGGSFGTLAVAGNFQQSATGTLELDLSRFQHDLLAVSGGATFGGMLELNQLGESLASYVPIQVVDAGSYTGNFSSLVSNLDGVVWFNPGNGTVTLISGADGTSSPSGGTANQRSVWISLYDDVIDPGVTNVTWGPSGLSITSGIADGENPDLLWDLAASFSPNGLNGAVLDRLSPEVYAGLSDYAVLATRTHQRSALSAPAFPHSPTPTNGTGSKGGTGSGAKGSPVAGSNFSGWEFFAAADAFHLETNSSPNQADYDLTGGGFLLGARTTLNDRLQFASYVGADWGDIDGDLVNADASGWSAGLIFQALLHGRTGTRLTAALSHGQYSFDGTRQSVSATALGWSPGGVDIPDVDSSATELFLGVDGTAWQNRNVRIVPSMGLRYSTSSMDGFRELTSSAAGAPVALNVGSDNYDTFLAEAGIAAEADINDQLSLKGEIGFNASLGEDSHVLSSSFVKGSRPFQVAAQGMNDDLLFIGFGTVYRPGDTVSIGVAWRSEFRQDCDASQSFSLSTSLRF
ncbi:autotransporter domain-containing protein [Luteolibacter marinus]|uniref:autotransporter domain-containing protein n=1 Tax=Luteolibacter marinus TaxID=2776705 RepID=UPI0018692A41